MLFLHSVTRVIIIITYIYIYYNIDHSGLDDIYGAMSRLGDERLVHV